MSAGIQEQLAECRAMLKQLLEAQATQLVYTRKEAAKVLRISEAQLYRLLAAGRLVALPSGIARTELERYARTPQPKLTAVMSRGKARRAASDEADRLEALLRATRRKPVRR